VGSPSLQKIYNHDYRSSRHRADID
jgi:hypothetical protein